MMVYVCIIIIIMLFKSLSVTYRLIGSLLFAHPHTVRYKKKSWLQKQNIDLTFNQIHALCMM